MPVSSLISAVEVEYCYLCIYVCTVIQMQLDPLGTKCMQNNGHTMPWRFYSGWVICIVVVPNNLGRVDASPVMPTL